MTEIEASAPAASAPGFTRRIRITPAPGRVRAAVEDDFHRMSVTLLHDNVTAKAVKAELLRAPWSTCPGAVATCEDTFTGIALAAFAAQKVKASNCTHLYDLALLAAAHALDAAPLVYDAFVSDPVAGVRRARLYRNAEAVLGWSDANYRVVEPAALAGMKLNEMRAWIESLAPAQQEAARILNWVSLIAHGRIIPMSAACLPRATPSSPNRPATRSASVVHGISAAGQSSRWQMIWKYKLHNATEPAGLYHACYAESITLTVRNMV